MNQTGVKSENISVSDGALNRLIKFYCRESGVRNLQKQIEKIFRKVAFKLVKENMSHVDVTEENLQDLVGNLRTKNNKHSREFHSEHLL